MSNIGTYLITDMKSGLFYIGSSKDMLKRIMRHLKELGNKTHHNKNFLDLWENTNPELCFSLFPTPTREGAYALEEELLKQNLNNPLLMNIGMSVRGGDNITLNPNREEIKSKIGLGGLKRYKEMSSERREELAVKVRGSNNPMFGRKHTPEVIEKLRSVNLGRPSAMKGITLSADRRQFLSEMAKTRVGSKNHFFGKSHSEETKDLIRQKNMGNLPPNSIAVIINGVYYASASRASKALGINNQTIINRIKSQRKEFSNYQYAKECPTTIETTSSEDKGVE